MDNSVFRKTMENVQKRRNTKLVTTNGRRNHLLSKPNYHTTKFFTENVLDKEMIKTQIFINKCLFRFLKISYE